MGGKRLKVTAKYSLRLLALLATMTLVLLAFIPMLSGGDWQWVGYVLSVAFLAIFFLMAAVEGGDRGEKDLASEQSVRRRVQEGGVAGDDEEGGFYTPSRGFVAGLIASIPTIIAGICMCVLQGDALIWATPVARILLSPYLIFFEPLRTASPMLERVSYLVFSLLFPLATGLGYIILGPKRRKKLEDAILKADKAKRKKSKVQKQRKKREEERKPIN